MDANSRAWRSVLVAVTLAACDGPARPPSVEAGAPVAAAPAAEMEAAEVAEPAAAAEEQRVGVLRYTELPRTKSVEAYLGREFSLAVEGGEPLNVKASAAVSSERLRGLDGATVTLRVRFHPESQPDPMESAPIGGMNGEPMARPAYYEVLEVVSAPAGR